ncbi:helix-turn-helix transcriptional regulator [Paenibacillus ihbetae]|uniref:Transcriptional regulator n=1 Tax=Paenibacillus ihbetae TaxID=1870820 RepID=A0ABX3JYZ0_9BACL|nr:helix-turn-helix transcriptional regulator [Paenibacillus ihbetae]OOC62174.1 transcriptional regulator [Paenibacillus ihbetae]
MKTTTTIRGEIERYINEHGMTINQFAKAAGINSGTLSSIINGRRPLSMKQLDQITSVMELEEGHFYEMYIEECIFNSTPDWRRLGPFLYRCAELGRLDCLDTAVRMTLDNTAYLQMLYELAETFVQEAKYKAAMLLYECVAESEKYQHSERLALCHYRLFNHRIENNQESNGRAVVLFEPYLERLNEAYQLDAYVRVINVSFSLDRWDNVRSLAERMGKKARIQYDNDNYLDTSKPNQPVIFYVLYSYLVLENCCAAIDDYDRALHYVSQYDYPDWIINPSEQEQKILNQFHEWATANRYLYRLLSGDREVLPEYVEYISTREDEIFIALCNIVLAANRHKMQIDHVLERFKDYIVHKAQRNKITKVNEQMTLNNYTRLLAELGIYYLNAKQYDRGLAYIVDSFEYAIRIRSDKGMLRCMGLFEQFRSFASAEIQQRYQELITEVQKLSVYAWMPVV